VLLIGILRPWKQRNIELIGHFEAELLGKEWAIWCVSLCTWHVSDKSFVENLIQAKEPAGTLH
jgi:hypothetical protein